MSLSIHDNHVLAITVTAGERTICLRTAYPERTGPEFTEVVFEGVEGYVFHGDALGTILFEIEPVDALALYREYAVEMQSVYRNNGGHGPWAYSDSSAEEFLAAGHVRGYRLSSAIGMEGAVWAQRLVIRNG